MDRSDPEVMTLILDINEAWRETIEIMDGLMDDAIEEAVGSENVHKIRVLYTKKLIAWGQ